MAGDIVLGIRLTADGSGLVGEVRISDKELAKLGKTADKTGAAARRGARGLDKYGREAKEAADKTRRLNRQSQQLTREFSFMRRAIIVLGLGALTRDISAAGMRMQAMETTLKAVTGSTAAAGEEMAFVREEAERLGLSLVATAGSYAQMAAAAKGTELAGAGVRDIFVAISEASSVLQLDAQRTELALFAVQQMISKGTVTAEELRRQLGDLLPGAFQIAARAMSVSTAELNKMIESGELMAVDFLPRFADEIRNTFGDALPEAVSSSRAELNRLKTAFFETKTEFAEGGFLTATTEGFKDLTAALRDEGTISAVRATSAAVGNMIGFATDNADAVAALAAGYVTMRAATASWLAVQTLLNTSLALSPVGLFSITVGAAAAGAVLLMTNIRQLEQVESAHAETLREITGLRQAAAGATDDEAAAIREKTVALLQELVAEAERERAFIKRLEMQTRAASAGALSDNIAAPMLARLNAAEIEASRKNLSELGDEIERLNQLIDDIGSGAARGGGIAANDNQPPPNARRGEALAREREAAQKHLDALFAANLAATQRDLELLNFREQQEIEALDRLNLTTEEKLFARALIEDTFREARIEATLTEQDRIEAEVADHLDAISRRFAVAAEANRQLWAAGLKGQLQVASGVFGQLAVLQDSHSRRMFKIGKAAAIAQASINAFQAAVASYNALAGIPIIGPALGAVAAAAALTYGLQQVQSIKSMQFSGGAAAAGAAPSIPSTGGGANDNTIADVPAVQPAVDTRPRIINITIDSDSGVVTTEWIRDSLLPSLNEALDDGDTLNVAA